MASFSIIGGALTEWWLISLLSDFPASPFQFFFLSSNSNCAMEDRSSKVQITHEAQWNKNSAIEKQPLSFTSSSWWPSFPTPAPFNSENHIIREGKHIQSQHPSVETTFISLSILCMNVFMRTALWIINIDLSGHNWAHYSLTSLSSMKSSWSVYRIF